VNEKSDHEAMPRYGNPSISRTWRKVTGALGICPLRSIHLFPGCALLFSAGALSDRARLRQPKRLPGASSVMFGSNRAIVWIYGAGEGICDGTVKQSAARWDELFTHPKVTGRDLFHGNQVCGEISDNDLTADPHRQTQFVRGDPYPHGRARTLAEYPA